MVNQQNCDVPLVCKFLEQANILIEMTLMMTKNPSFPFRRALTMISMTMTMMMPIRMTTLTTMRTIKMTDSAALTNVSFFVNAA